MAKNKALKVVNVVLLVLLLNQACSGLFRASYSLEAFEWLHERAAFLLFAVSAAHIVLNWNWIKASYFKKT
jgi:heme A synthase